MYDKGSIPTVTKKLNLLLDALSTLALVICSIIRHHPQLSLLSFTSISFCTLYQTSLAAGLLRVLCADGSIREQVKVFDGIPICLR